MWASTAMTQSESHQLSLLIIERTVWFHSRWHLCRESNVHSNVKDDRLMLTSAIDKEKNIFITSYFLLLSHLWIREPGPLFSCLTVLSSSRQSSSCGLFLETKVTCHEWGILKRRGFFENLNHCLSQDSVQHRSQRHSGQGLCNICRVNDPDDLYYDCKFKMQSLVSIIYLFYIFDTHALNQTAFLISELVLLQITAMFYMKKYISIRARLKPW